MIKQFDNQNLKTLRADIEAAFRTIGQNHGVSLSIGIINYDPTVGRATTKLTMIATGDASTATDPRAAAAAKAQAEFKLYAESFGLKADQYGAIIKNGHNTYKLIGFSPRSPRYPILATNLANGKTFKLPESIIASLQSEEYRKLYGIVSGMCSNDHAYDENYREIGKCNRLATTTRNSGFGRDARMQPFCAQCAQIIDESRAEMAAGAHS